MAINWNEVRAKAAAFSERHKLARLKTGATKLSIANFWDLYT